MSKFVNPFTDLGFKMIFGQEVTKDLLLDFLNDLLEGERHINNITLLKTELIPFPLYGRGVVFDILCQSDTGEKFLVEMQNQQQSYAKDRFVFYASRLIYEQGLKGKGWKFELVPVYGVFFLNFRLQDTEEGRLRRDIALADLHTGKSFSDKLRLIFLELPYFTKEESECETNFERWLYVLKNMETLERMPFLAQKAAFEKLMEVANVANFTPEQLQEYEANLDAYRVMNGALEFREAKGKAQGEIRGEARGRVKGRAEERAKAEAEKREIVKKAKAEKQELVKKAESEKWAMAREMKTEGLTVEKIARITGLSSDEIEKL